MQVKDFPLCWPEGYERTAAADRAVGRFRSAFKSAYNALFDEAKLLHEGDREFAISTNVPLDAEGMPVVAVAKKQRIADPGVAVYVWRGGRPYGIACDTYLDVASNMRALAATIAALRTIARHGTASLLAQSMIGFSRQIEAPTRAPVPRLVA